VKLARVLGAIGRVMITAGVLILLFVVYQLWGTGLHTREAQNEARDEFDQSLQDAGVDELPAVSNDTGPVRRPGRQPIPHAPDHGQQVALIQIPAIGIDDGYIVHEGVDLDTLQEGPGHYEGTPLPGEQGNAAIAGHRTTYLAPFNRIDELGEGDRIVVTYPNGSRFVYQYLNTVIVTPDQTEVLEYKFDNRLTLTACNPKYSAAQRIVVSARLLGHHARRAERDPEQDQVRAQDVDLSDESLDGVDQPRTPAVVGGLAAASVWLAAWAVGRAWRRWPAYLVGLPIFLVMLYGFFENFVYLLPASY
jgi:sortase A